MTERPRRREQDTVVRELEDEGETAILNTASSNVAVLNATAAAIWYLCDGTRTAAEIAAEICQTVGDVDPARVESDVRSSLEELARLGLLE